MYLSIANRVDRPVSVGETLATMYKSLASCCR